MTTHGGPPATLPSHLGILVVGAGFSGIAAAVALRRAGLDQGLLVVERRGQLGGTWYDNTYPGCRCDVPSNLYSLSFAPNPRWTETFSTQAEIECYLDDTARRFGVRQRIAFDCTVRSCRWDARAHLWRVRTSRGDLSAEVVVNAGGLLSEPSVPRLPGAASFGGRTFHSARWDHGHDLSGASVAVIGTGASAVQFIPFVQRLAGHLTVFVRTPPWVVPHTNRPTTALERALFARLPPTQRMARAARYWSSEAFLGRSLVRNGPGLRAVEHLARRHLGRQVADPALRAALTPTYRAGCKRLLLSNDFYPALQRPNVSVVTGAVAALEPGHVVSARGTRHRADTVIYGTGFSATSHPMAGIIVGADGRTLAEHWADTGMQAFCGTSVVGFPNFFMVAGPNTGTGHTSLLVMIEAQVAHIAAACRARRDHAAHTIAVRPQAFARWNRHIAARSPATVWSAGGCASWYLDAAGRNTTLWPGSATTFVRRTRTLDLDDYEFGSAP